VCYSHYSIPMDIKKTLVLSFLMFFFITITVPYILVSLDDSVEISMLYELNEEEQEDIKVLFEYSSNYDEVFPYYQSNNDTIGDYTNKSYLMPQLSLLLPPPKQYSC
jgi:hypothetical protein